MPVSLEFLRGVLGAISLFFAHFLGRAVAKRKQRQRPLYTWALRYILTIGAICYRGVDNMAIIILVLDAAMFAAGFWDEWRPKRQEDLTRTMFPDDQ